MATPPEEVARQHEEARQLVEQGLPCDEPLSEEEIPLSMKVCPTIDIFEEEKKSPEEDEEERQAFGNILSWSSRGRVPIEKLQALVSEGYRIEEHTKTEELKEKIIPAKEGEKTDSQKNKKQSSVKKYTADDIKSNTNLWDPINAAVNNVHIMRPSHDAWGIGKIVLIFADDFLKDVYELPWWHGRDDIRDAIQPILDVLQIQPTQVVRLLLASLPPGTTIPLHQDSGAWVKETHRCHCPVIVKKPEQVIFRVGRTDTQLQRIDCTPGHVFEINNQGRHAVSNCSNDYRVHLILDYMDVEAAATKLRLQLDPGERLVQTRRSVDRLKDQGARPTPSFLILGAQKAGTTSLYEYMMQHPLIVRPKRRETHCLDWRWLEALQPGKKFTEKQHLAHCHKFFEEKALRLHPSCCTGDSTPSYLLDSRRVISNLKCVFPWRIQFLVTTRNPIQRAESHYAMVTSPEGTPAQLKTRGMEWRKKTFRQVAMEELEQMKECGLLPYWNMETGVCDEAIFKSFMDTEEEDKAWYAFLERNVPLNTGSYGLLARGLYALNLRPWLKDFDKSQFLVLQLEKDLHSDNVRSTMERVFDHVGVPSSFELEDVSPQNAREYEPKMDSELYQYLQRFFEPHNQRLEALLKTLSM